MYQLWYYRGVWDDKDCIGLYQSFQIVSLCLNYLHHCLNFFYHLMLLFWRERLCTVDALYCCDVPALFLRFWPLFSDLYALGERTIFISPTSWGRQIVVSTLGCCHWKYLFALGWWFLWHHHGVGYCLSSCYRKFSALFQLFNYWVKGFHGVVWPIIFTAFSLISISWIATYM